MSLPEILDEELVLYHLDAEREVALATYVERTGLTARDTDLKVITEQFEWEWYQRLYGGQEP